MDFGERAKQKEFETALTKKRDELLWKKIVKKYGKGATVDQLSDEDARTLLLLKGRADNTLTEHGVREAKKLPTNFKPPSNIRDESVDTKPTRMEKIATNPYIRSFLE